MLAHIRPLGHGLHAGLGPYLMAQLTRLNVRDRPRPARCPEPLCPLRVLPFKGWRLPPPREALPPHHRSYGLMRQTITLPLPSMYTAGLCRLSPVPAGRWPFPTLSPQVFPQVPGPLPRWDPMVHMPVSSHRTSAFPVLQASRLPHLIRTATSVRDFYEAAVIPLCSGPKVCSPPRSLLPQSPKTGQP